MHFSMLCWNQPLFRSSKWEPVWVDSKLNIIYGFLVKRLGSNTSIFLEQNVKSAEEAPNVATKISVNQSTQDGHLVKISIGKRMKIPLLLSMRCMIC